MSALNNNSGLNNDLYAPLVAAAQYAAYEQSIARQIATVFDMPANSGKVVQVPVWSSVSATTPEENNAATFADTDSSAKNITLSEKVVAHRISDMLRDSAYNDVFAQLGDQSGRAIAEAMDAELFAEFANFTTDIGSTSTEITADTLFKAAATLRGRKLVGPFIGVFHPGAIYNLKKTMTATTSYQNATATASAVMNGFYVGTIAGIQVYESALVATDGSVSTASINGVFVQQALAHSMRGSIRLETMRQAAYRATDLVLTGVSGATTLQPTFGVKLTANKVVD
jgi:N4-gp56 family major capsid protein